MLDKLFVNTIHKDFRKQYYLGLVFMLLATLIIYYVAFTPTLVQREQYKQVSATYQQIKNNPNEISLLKSKLAAYYKQGPTKSNNTANETIAAFCHNNHLKLSYPTALVQKNNNFFVETNIYEVTGSFQDITRLAYYIEQEDKTGNIVSLQYELKKNFETRLTYLQATIYLQTIKNIQDEN